MNVYDAIRMVLKSADQICLGYVQDLSDQELMERPHPACNHVNWQLGHLIVSEHELINLVSGKSMPPLPDGFARKYSKDMSHSDDSQAFATKDELLRVQKEQRAGTLAALEKVSESDLDKPSGVHYAPTVGAVYSTIGSHWLMHAGQWVIVRRKFGKPPLF